MTCLMSDYISIRIVTLSVTKSLTKLIRTKEPKKCTPAISDRRKHRRFLHHNSHRFLIFLTSYKSYRMTFQSPSNSERKRALFFKPRKSKNKKSPNRQCHPVISGVGQKFSPKAGSIIIQPLGLHCV